MTPRRYLVLAASGLAALLLLALALPATSSPTTSSGLLADALFAAPRWWDDTLAWIRSIGWDRSRLVQLWLFFMLVGLYVMLRIKPRG
jgi:hypothetical protein